MQPKIGDIAKSALAFVAGIGVGLLQFLASFIIAGIIMAFGEAGNRGAHAIFDRLAGKEQGEEFAKLSTATIRAVAQGVIGVAFIQAIVIGVCLLIAGIPWAGVLVLIVLVLGIAQVPALIVTLPAIGYIWWSGDYGTVAAVVDTVLLFAAGMTDNVLKPLMLGRGVDAPMPVILLGALGGMATAGILGMFVGATLLALGYQIFTGWVAATQKRSGLSPENRCRGENLSGAVHPVCAGGARRPVVDGDGAAECAHRRRTWFARSARSHTHVPSLPQSTPWPLLPLDAVLQSVEFWLQCESADGGGFVKRQSLESAAPAATRSNIIAR